MAAATSLGCHSCLLRSSAAVSATRRPELRLLRCNSLGLQLRSPPCGSELFYQSTSSPLLHPAPPQRSATQLPAGLGTPRRATSASRARGAVGGANPSSVTDQDSVSFPELKKFLEDSKSVGRVRIIVNTGVAVLESVCTLEKLFYKAIPGKGEYANLINPEDNVDFHLLLDKVAKVRLARGKSMQGNITTYMLRFVDASNAVGASIFVMWRPGTSGTYDPGQVEAFEELVLKYGEEVSFLAEGSEEASEL